MFPKAQLDGLKQFVGLLQDKPELLHSEQLNFFRSYLLSLGATLPDPPAPKAEPAPEPKPEPPKPEPVEEEEEEEEPEEPEEAPEEDPGLWTADEVVPVVEVEVKEVSEEDVDKAMALKAEAMEVQGEDSETAIAKLSEAIKLNPGMAMLYGMLCCASGLLFVWEKISLSYQLTTPAHYGCK